MRVTYSVIVLAIVFAPSVRAVRAFSRHQTQAPARDHNKTEQEGTSIIRGRVFAAETSRPLRRARLVLSAPELNGQSRTINTNADGRYEFPALPAGRYSIRAARSGYLTLLYGQRRPLDQGKPLQLAEKQLLENIDFSLPRMSVLSGHLSDEFGDPIEGVHIYALRSVFLNGRRQLMPVGSGDTRTDEAGQFRLLSLPPGRYFVSASTRETWTVSRDGASATFGYAPTYFPGVNTPTGARRITVGVGQEVSNVDFSLVTGRAARISGTAFDSHNRPFSSVTLRAETRGSEFNRVERAGSAAVDSGGGFVIRDVPPGEYKLQAISSMDEPDVAIETVFVVDGDLDNISLRGSKGGSATGQVLTDDGTVPHLPGLRVSLSEHVVGRGADPLLAGAFKTPGVGTVDGDGTFSVKGVFGKVRFQMNLPEDWALVMVRYDGRDITDTPIELNSGDTLTGVSLIVTKRTTELSGDIVDDKGAPLPDGTVIVFASDPTKWYEDSRYVRSARPDQKGHWLVKGLPPGEYLAVAVDFIDEGEWTDPEYLQSVQRDGRKLTLQALRPEKISLKLIITQTQ